MVGIRGGGGGSGGRSPCGAGCDASGGGRLERATDADRAPAAAGVVSAVQAYEDACVQVSALHVEAVDDGKDGSAARSGSGEAARGASGALEAVKAGVTA